MTRNVFYVTGKGLRIFYIYGIARSIKENLIFLLLNNNVLNFRCGIENGDTLCYNKRRQKKVALYMVNNIKVKALIFIAVFAAAIAAVFGVFLKPEPYAYAADATVSVSSLKGTYFIGVNGTEAVLEEKDYTDEKYPKSVTVRFRVLTEYYLLEKTKDGVKLPGKTEETPADGFVTETLEESGNYELKITGCSDFSGTQLDSTTVSFKVDADAPAVKDGEKVFSPMTGWLREGGEYLAVANWNALYDDRSGVKTICYYFEYPNGSKGQVGTLDFASLDRTEFRITEKSTLVAVCYDNAGNGLTTRFAFDKFDFIAPSAPTYEITPELKQGFYSSEYTVKVTFMPDVGGSGLNQTQYYTIYENGVPFTRTYEQASSEVCSIRLTAACDHKIIIYATDNAGNVSETKTVTVPFSAFDVTEPIIKDEPSIAFDVLNSDSFFTVSVYATDKNESGISKATVVYGEKSYAMQADPTESAGYVRYAVVLPYGSFNAKVREFTVVLKDAAGNRAERVGTIPYFSDDETFTMINRAVKAADGYDESAYTDAAAKSVKKDAEKLGRLLSYSGNAKADILNTAQSLIESIESAVSCSLVIESVPEYASAIISFSAYDGDFVGYKKGTLVTLTLVKGESDGKDYPSVVNAGKAFTDFFGLKLTINGEEFDGRLEKGLTVKMNMPGKYLDRTVALVNVKTGEVVPSEIVNNAIRFTLKESTDYALVIYGGKAPTGTIEETKTITVFGKEMPLSRFLWIVCGCGGAAVVLVVVLIVLKKKMG